MTVKLTDHQQTAARFTGNQCVVAGAGSGKTMTLVQLVLGLIGGDYSRDRVDINEILALTYTEKAAREMKDRIRVGLNQRIQEAEDDPTRAFWADQRRRLDRANISTIHSFCLAVLRQHALEAGLDPEFDLTEQLPDFTADARREVLLSWIKDEEPDLMNLLAYYPWMGRGWSRGVDHLVDLILNRSRTIGRPLQPADPPELDLGPVVDELTAVADLIQSLHAAGQIKDDKEYGRRALALAQSIEGIIGPELGVDRLLEVSVSWAELLKGNWYKGKPAKERAVEAVGRIERERHRRAAAPVKAALARLTERMDAAMRGIKRRRGLMDFDDLLLETRTILAENPDIRRRLKERHQVVLVDEFQDANRLQTDLAAYLIEPLGYERLIEADREAYECLERGPGKLSVFGDAKQSIYRFRGAEVEVFDWWRREVARQRPEGVVSLATNFRSSRPLIDFFNAFFQQAMGDGAFSDLDRQQWHRAGWDHPAVILATTPAGESEGERRWAEAEALADYIEALLSGRAGVRVGDDGRTPAPGDAAILLRRYTHLERYEQALRRRGIQYHTVRGRGFYQCREVWDLINLIFFLADPTDETALLGLLRSPLFGLDDETITRLVRPPAGGPIRLSSHIKGPATPKPIDVSGESWAVIEKAREVIRPMLDDAARWFPSEILERAVEETDYLALLLGRPQGAQKAANVQKLIEVSRVLNRDAAYLPGEAARFFRARLAEETADPEAQVIGEDDAVKIMTIHQAKGLEFPVVIVPDCGRPPRGNGGPVRFGPEDRFALRLHHPETGETLEPQDFASFKEEDQREERGEHARLLYVAATRAKDHLLFSAAVADNPHPDAWLSWLSEFAADRPELIQSRRLEAAERAPAQPPADFDDPPSPTAPRAVELVDKVLERTPRPPSRITLNVTGLAQYLACPRWYYLEHVLGLPATAPESNQARGPSRARELGLTFHHLMETIDLTRNPSADELDLRAAEKAEREGWALTEHDRRDLARRVFEFLDTPWGRDLTAADPASVRRETPIWVKIAGGDQGSDLVLTGEIDLFYFAPGGAGRLLDYKLARPKDADRYAPQIQVYALGLYRSGVTNLEAGLYFTWDHDRRLHVVELPPGWPAVMEQRLRTAAQRLGKMMAPDAEPASPPDPCPQPGCPMAAYCR